MAAFDYKVYVGCVCKTALLCRSRNSRIVVLFVCVLVDQFWRPLRPRASDSPIRREKHAPRLGPNCDRYKTACASQLPKSQHQQGRLVIGSPARKRNLPPTAAETEGATGRFQRHKTRAHGAARGTSEHTTNPAQAARDCESAHCTYASEIIARTLASWVTHCTVWGRGGSIWCRGSSPSSS
jgi:hypothetical protein